MSGFDKWCSLTGLQANEQDLKQMTFDDLLGDVRNNDEVVIPSDWGQGRATFGGLVAALMFEVMASKVADDRAMR
ncbi:MAG TPA: acyl-CoA thioesterase II, partial [Marinobacter hydrocarbonoclasticus]|nr:acyl-CoA thioesterase II [Marinobacter nauticus]